MMIRIENYKVNDEIQSTDQNDFQVQQESIDQLDVLDTDVDGTSQDDNLGDLNMEEDELERAHEEMINKILEEEEEVIAAHRQHIDEIMELMKKVTMMKMLLTLFRR
jgi:hypothetical protein